MDFIRFSQMIHLQAKKWTEGKSVIYKERQQHHRGCGAGSIHPWLAPFAWHQGRVVWGHMAAMAHMSLALPRARFPLFFFLGGGRLHSLVYLLASFIFFAGTKAKLVKWVSYLLKEFYLFTRLAAVWSIEDASPVDVFILTMEICNLSQENTAAEQINLCWMLTGGLQLILLFFLFSNCVFLTKA